MISLFNSNFRLLNHIFALHSKFIESRCHVLFQSINLRIQLFLFLVQLLFLPLEIQLHTLLVFFALPTHFEYSLECLHLCLDDKFDSINERESNVFPLVRRNLQQRRDPQFVHPLLVELRAVIPNNRKLRVL